MAKLVTRKKILTAAENLFAKNGYDGVPTKLIAQEAGVTEMTLFNHFHTKENLYRTVVTERFMSFEIESTFSELTYNDLEADLKVITDHQIKNFLDNKHILMMRLKERESFLEDDNFKLEHDPMFKQILPFFKVYEEKGLVNRPGENVALSFIATLKGILYVSLIEDKTSQYIESFVSDYINIFCCGVLVK